MVGKFKSVGATNDALEVGINYDDQNIMFMIDDDTDQCKMVELEEDDVIDLIEFLNHLTDKLKNL